MPLTAEKRILAGYFTQWGPARGYAVKNIESSGAAAKLTHLLYAFASVSPAGHCESTDPAADKRNFDELRALKKRHPNLKTLISLGGYSLSSGFSKIAATPALRSSTAMSCIAMFLDGDLFDGVDIDWEYPDAADTQNFTSLLIEFRRQLDAEGKKRHRHFLLTIAAPAGEQHYSKIDLARIPPFLDFINLMTYDYNGAWDKTTNHLAPLPSIDSTVRGYLKGGVPANKIVLGMPFYGRGWQGVPARNHGLLQTSTGPAPGTYEPGADTYKVLARLPASPATATPKRARNGSTTPQLECSGRTTTPSRSQAKRPTSRSTTSAAPCSGSSAETTPRARSYEPSPKVCDC